MLHKILSVVLLIACNATVHALQDNDYPLATTPVSKKLALSEMLQAGYFVQEQDLVFKGNPDTGANFIDAIISQINPATGEAIEIRAVYYQSGGQVGDHTHNEKEIFHVTRGGCKVFILEQDSQGRHYWGTSIKQKGDDIVIDAYKRHALIAGKQGLCMHIARNDMTRSVEFSKTLIQPWENQSLVNIDDKSAVQARG